MFLRQKKPEVQIRLVKGAWVHCHPPDFRNWQNGYSCTNCKGFPLEKLICVQPKGKHPQ